MQSPLEQPITNLIREAIMNHRVRDSQFSEIEDTLLVSRYTAKSLYYAFLWRADEDSLNNILLRDNSFLDF